MTGRGNDIRESDPEIEIIPSAERIKLLRQREHLVLLLVKMGFRQLSSNNGTGPAECVFLLKDSAAGNEKMGVRIFIPEDNDCLQMALLGDADENAAIAWSINAGGYFSATQDSQERCVIGEYYNVKMTNEPPVTSTTIKYISLGSSNRILALLKKVIFG